MKTIDENNFKLADLVEPLICDYCGKELPRNVAFCPHCGNEIKNHKVKIDKTFNSTTKPAYDGLVKPINKWVSFALCFFFGYFGIHKFYEGNTKMGIVYLLTGGLLGFGWLVDIFVILFKPNPYYVNAIK